MRVPLTYQQNTLLVCLFWSRIVLIHERLSRDAARAQERLANPLSMTSSAIRRRLIWRNWVRIRKTVRVTPDGLTDKL